MLWSFVVFIPVRPCTLPDLLPGDCMMPAGQDYCAMPRTRLVDGELTLRAVQPKDIEAIRQWRNAQMDVLRQSAVITPEAQQHYFAKYVWPCKTNPTPSQILLAIERHGKLIGYGGLVHISWAYRRAEISFLLEPKLEADTRTLAEYFSRFLRMMHSVAFEDLQLQRLTTETYANRHFHIQALVDAGHKLEGRLKAHVIVDGKPCDALLHGLLAVQWRAQHCATELPGLLVTSAGSKLPLIRGCQAAAERLPQGCRVWAGDTDPDAPARWAADAFWHMPRLSHIAPANLIEECLARSINIVLPTRDGELPYWAQHRDDFARAGIQVLVSCPQSIARCRDKLSFARLGQEANLPIIPAHTSPDAFGQVPLVVKDRFGAGSRGIGLQLSPSGAREHARLLEEPVFQPFISGLEISIDGWVSHEGAVAGLVLRRRERVVSGESQVTTTFQDAALEAQALRVLTALDLRGPVVLQAIVEDGELKVIECNPRFGGASTSSIAVGLDSIYWSLAEALGLREPPIFKRSSTEVRQVRAPHDLLIYGPNI
jgi:carbamoyl-phosphate synthase large subunit